MNQVLSRPTRGRDQTAELRVSRVVLSGPTKSKALIKSGKEERVVIYIVVIP